MKYIRTKDEIFVLSTKHEHLADEYGAINQADTIEELCNEFVLCEDNHYCIVSDIEAKEMATTNYGIIYGAIWTDKGLIYVAKMNDKGELELL